MGCDGLENWFKRSPETSRGVKVDRCIVGVSEWDREPVGQQR